MPYCAADKLFLSADQVLSKVAERQRLGGRTRPEFARRVSRLTASSTTTLPYDVMVLPGHGVPFYGSKTRIKQPADHHEERCRLIADAAWVSKTSRELVPVVFHKYPLDVHQMDSLLRAS